jgi:hypothetical protein
VIVSALGGFGKSDGRWGNNVDTSSGWEVKSGVMFAGVKISVSEYSVGSGSVNYCKRFEGSLTWWSGGSGGATCIVRG